MRRKKLLHHVDSEIPTAINLPVEVEVGGAIVFVVDVQQFHEM